MIRTADVPLACLGVISSGCDGRDVRLMTTLTFAPRPTCAACRAAAESLGLPLREVVARPTDRRRSRFAFLHERLGRRSTDGATEGGRMA